MSAIPPKPETLENYGLTETEWWEMLKAQGGVCAICGKTPSSGRFNTDHQHGRQRGKWQDMEPHQRKALLRGLLCWTCNRLIVGRGVTIAKLRAAVAYLEGWKAREAVQSPPRARRPRQKSYGRPAGPVRSPAGESADA